MRGAKPDGGMVANRDLGGAFDLDAVGPDRDERWNRGNHAMDVAEAPPRMAATSSGAWR